MKRYLIILFLSNIIGSCSSLLGMNRATNSKDAACCVCDDLNALVALLVELETQTPTDHRFAKNQLDQATRILVRQTKLLSKTRLQLREYFARLRVCKEQQQQLAQNELQYLSEEYRRISIELKRHDSSFGN